MGPSPREAGITRWIVPCRLWDYGAGRQLCAEAAPAAALPRAVPEPGQAPFAHSEDEAAPMPSSTAGPQPVVEAAGPGAGSTTLQGVGTRQAWPVHSSVTLHSPSPLTNKQQRVVGVS